MATDRLSAQVIADDSDSTWRFEKPAGTLAMALAGSRLAAHNTLVAVRAADSDDAYIALGTGGETGTTLDYYLKLDGANDDLTIFTAGGVAAITIDSAGAVTIPSLAADYTILTGTTTTDPPSLAAGAGHVFTITVTGCSTTGTPNVIVTPSVELIGNGIVYFARVTAADTVTVTYLSIITTVNIGSHTVRATVLQY